VGSKAGKGDGSEGRERGDGKEDIKMMNRY